MACGRKATPAPTLARDQPKTSPAPVPQDDYIPLPVVDDGEENGPPRSSAYAPTEYVDLPAARPGPAQPTARNTCDFVGEVWDFAGEQGCQQVVETTEGYLFSVVKVPPGYYLEGGSRIRFGFEYDRSGQGPNCGADNANIRITCLQLLRSASGFPRPIVCHAHDEPSQWIHELIRDLGATYVTRFPWDGERVVYLFETPSGQYLYDCRGFILCQPPTNCLKFIEDFNAGTQIFEG